MIVKGNRLISTGWNLCKTHPKSNTYNQTIHAELHAILRSKESLNNCSIYVYREKKDYSMGLAKPCKFCQEVLIANGIKTIYYSSNEGYETLNL